ncbi:autophagy-related protein 13a isoform X2 [Cryptomeria japonica]|uniref:autophagy-related protein 13a isoform X2 n=1 Tax=Cryptomeria japonica TaxID=3369 RepID=UPI0025AD6E07|nr:autophagy-related protein 13a isoform X2 [Cryptomeria japonica]
MGFWTSKCIRDKMDIKSKVDQIVRYLFVMSIQIILQSRIPVRGQSAAESTASPSSSSPKEIEEFPFNLALKKFPTDVAALEACKKNGFRSVVLDVLPIQSPQQQTEVSFRHGKLQKFLKTVMSQQPDRRSVLERWVLQYVKHEDGQNAEKQTYSMERMIARVYKSTMVLMRSLISMTRLLPAYRAFQLANTSSYGKFFGLWYQFLQLPQPLLHGEGTHMNSYKFPSINVPFGKICLSVDYRSLVASDFNFPSAPRLPKIVPDYYRGGSTTDPVKILSDDCYSKNMMLNFGGSLPLTGSALSAPPSDSYRNEDSNYCKFATTSLRHSYIQRALQTIPLSRSRSCRCMAFSPLKQLHCDVLCTKQTERVPRTFPVDKSALMFSGAYDYCREVEVAASLPFAVDNDSSVNSLSSLASRQSAQINETMAKEADTIQIPRDAAIGALVELLNSAPPLRQFTASESSGDLKLSRPSFEKDGDIHTRSCKAHTSGFPVENSCLKLSNSLKQGMTSSSSKTTVGQALKELDVLKGIKNQILKEKDNNRNQI